MLINPSAFSSNELQMASTESLSGNLHCIGPKKRVKQANWCIKHQGNPCDCGAVRHKCILFPPVSLRVHLSGFLPVARGSPMATTRITNVTRRTMVSAFLFFPRCSPWLGAEAGAGVGARAGAGVKAGAGEGMANPMESPSARGAVLGPTPSEANREWDGLAHLVECLESPQRCNQRETSPPVFACK